MTGQAVACRPPVRAGIAVAGPDGTRLATDVYLPAGDAPVPAVVTRTPYDRSAFRAEGLAWRARGVAFVAQDVRGRYGSDGTWRPYHHERADGGALVEWVAAQPWCDGAVVVSGSSYGAFTAWSAAVAVPHRVRAVLSAVPALGLDRVKFDPSGILRLDEHSRWWLDHADGRVSRAGLGSAMLAEEPDVLAHLPLGELPGRLWADVPEWAAVVRAGRRPGPEDLADADLALLDVAAFHVAGLYDLLLDDAVRLWELAGSAREPRPPRRLLIGPWDHSLTSRAAPAAGDRASGGAGRVRIGEVQLAWLRELLAGTAPASSASVYLPGTDDWRHSDDWPPPGPCAAPWHATAAGRLAGEPGPPGTSAFPYDPLDPMPSLLAGTDRSGLDGRVDAARFRSAPAPAAVRIEGRPVVHLRAATSAPASDWVVRLLERCADGRAFALAQASAVADGPGGHRVTLPPVAVGLVPGSCVELEVTSSDFPFLARNLNTGADRYTTAATSLARQSIAVGAGGTTVLLPCVTPW